MSLLLLLYSSQNHSLRLRGYASGRMQPCADVLNFDYAYTMASNIVKCVNCNIVVNELLAFMQNKADVMDEESLVRICIDCFSDEDITTAKRLLFDSVPNSKRINRRNKKKHVRDIDDIICLLKQTDPEAVPTFVARDLHKLPPVTFDHIDATKMLKDIVLLQTQLRTVQGDCDKLKTDMENVKQASSVNNHFSFVNRRRGAAFLDMQTDDYDSGPMALHNQSLQDSDKLQRSSSPYLEKNINNFSPNCEGTSVQQNTHVCSVWRKLNTDPLPSTPTSRGPLELHSVTEVVSLSPTKQVPAVTLSRPVTVQCESETSALLRNPGKTKSPELLRVNDQCKQKEDWKIVNYKKPGNKSSKGKLGKANVDSECKFKAAELKLPIFITNVSKSTKESDIISYIKGKTNEEVTLYKINRQVEKKYNSFKLYVARKHLATYLSDVFWPDGISFRRFVYENYKTKASSKPL